MCLTRLKIGRYAPTLVVNICCLTTKTYIFYNLFHTAHVSGETRQDDIEEYHYASPPDSAHRPDSDRLRRAKHQSRLPQWRLHRTRRNARDRILHDQRRLRTRRNLQRGYLPGRYLLDLSASARKLQQQQRLLGGSILRSRVGNLC